MVQPKYSPQEALERIKLMMNYDSSKTLNENKETISEQLAAPAAAGAVAGAGLGAGAAATGLVSGSLTGSIASLPGLATSVGLALTPAGTIAGTAATVGFGVIGGAVGLGLLPLAYWLITKDTGANKVKKMFEMCSSEASKIAKLPRKLQDTDLRSISDDIEDAIINDSYGFRGGTDEEKLFGAFKQLEGATASDFCALVQYYNKNSDSGDLFDDLDSDIDAESEWKQIFRPIRNCVEDSLLTIKDETVEVDCTVNPNQEKCKGGKSGYKDCSGTYSFGCKSEAIRKVQGCLGGLTTDGKFGPNTQKALKAKGFDSFTDADVDKICGKTTEEDPEISGEEQRISVDTEF
jgi:hypothetical protein